MTGLAFGLKRSLIVWLRPWFDRLEYRSRSGLARGLKRRGGLGFLPFKPASAEERWLGRLDLAGKTVYDIGGWEGVTTMFFARRVGRSGKVFTFEPHPENRAKIVANLKLNRFANVEVLPIAVGAAPGEATMISRRADLGTSSLHTTLKSRLATSSDAREHAVAVDTLDNIIATRGLPDPDFVKIDVEGMEGDVLAGMIETIRRRRPAILVELHDGGQHANTNNRIVVTETLLALGYRVRHVELDQTITTADATATGHLYCA